MKVEPKVAVVTTVNSSASPSFTHANAKSEPSSKLTSPPSTSLRFTVTKFSDSSKQKVERSISVRLAPDGIVRLPDAESPHTRQMPEPALSKSNIPVSFTCRMISFSSVTINT